jgi:PadR family transcriptional regulator AphA
LNIHLLNIWRLMMSPMVPLPLTIEHALLGYLNQRPMHGYEISQHLANSEGLGAVWRLKQSQLYALLSKLEEKGYITATIEPQDARPPRKVYHLTEEGKITFMKWIQSPVLHGRQIRLDFLAKLYFARRVDISLAKALIERQREVCYGWLDELHSSDPLLPSEGDSSYEWLVNQYREGQVQATLKWLDLCWDTLVEGLSIKDS